MDLSDEQCDERGTESDDGVGDGLTETRRTMESAGGSLAIERKCAIPFCEFDDEEAKESGSNGDDYRLLSVCLNGHFMHAGCIRSFVRNQRRLVCPHCRDDSLGELRRIFQNERFDEENDDDDMPPELFSTAFLLRAIYQHAQAMSATNNNHEATPAPGQYTMLPSAAEYVLGPFPVNYHGTTSTTSPFIGDNYIRTQPHRQL